MNLIKKSSLLLVKAAKGDPSITTLSIFIFYILFSVLESIIEKVMFGKIFINWLDLVLIVGGIVYAFYSVLLCAQYQDHRN